MDERLRVGDIPDYSGALNGLQVAPDPDRPIRRIAAAVDASERVIDEAVAEGADLLVVHHGLFWDSERRVTGRRYRKLAALLQNGMGVYSVHLPHDAHETWGNCAVLAGALGLRPDGRFGVWKDLEIGFAAPAATAEPGTAAAPGWKPPQQLSSNDWTELEHRLREGDREAWVRWTSKVVGQEVTLLPGGPERVSRVGLVTGGGGSFIGQAHEAGVDTLVTGEGAHHTWLDSHELGVNVIYAGHYATETWGVRALAQELSNRFGPSWFFIDDPSGL